MKFEEILRESRRVRPDRGAVERWRRAAFQPETVALPFWLPSLASGIAMAAMLLLWPAAAKGPVALRAAGVACDGRWEVLSPLRGAVGDLARPVPVAGTFAAADHCSLCHLDK